MLQDACANKLDAHGDGFMEDLLENAVRMQSMLDDLLEFSRFGRLAPGINKIELNAVVERSCLIPNSMI